MAITMRQRLISATVALTALGTAALPVVASAATQTTNTTINATDEQKQAVSQHQSG